MQLKQQHEIHKFQETVKANRAVFERRIETARQDLLAKHLSEHKAFWSKHGPAESTAKQAKVSSSKNAAATSSRHVTSPPPRSSTARPGTSKGKQIDKRSVTPNKPAQRAQVPPAHKKQPHGPSKLKSAPEVIDLCDSGDEGDQYSAPKRPLVPRSATHKPTRQVVDQHNGQDTGECMTIDQDATQWDQAQHNTIYPIPEATLELFGGVPKKQTVSLQGYTLDTCLQSAQFGTNIKREEQQRTSTSIKHLSSSTSVEKEFHGLPNTVPASTFPQRPSAVALQPGQQDPAKPFISSQPRLLGLGQQGDVEASTSSGIFGRAASAAPRLVFTTPFISQAPNFGAFQSEARNL